MLIRAAFYTSLLMRQRIEIKFKFYNNCELMWEEKAVRHHHLSNFTDMCEAFKDLRAVQCCWQQFFLSFSSQQKSPLIYKMDKVWVWKEQAWKALKDREHWQFRRMLSWSDCKIKTFSTIKWSKLKWVELKVCKKSKPLLIFIYSTSNFNGILEKPMACENFLIYH